MTDPFIRQFPEYRQIELTRGYYAIVDAENYEWLNQFKWHARIDGNRVYAARMFTISKGKQTAIRIHQQIMMTPKGMETDHRNGDGLCNTYDNLRVCTKMQNQHNQQPRPGASSRFKGVKWYKQLKKWQASIQYNHKNMHLGYFHDEEDAARAYNASAKMYHGEYACLNPVDPLFP